jgi:penicillin-binding protein 2
MYRSIVVSCDTYYYQLASELDIDDLAGFMKTLGFGQKTGIYIEGELTGVLPSRAWKRQRFAGAQYREEHRKWYLGDNISVGIGQGYNAFTPMQLAYATAIVANDGVAYRPHLVKSVEDIRTGQARPVAPQPTHRLGVTPEQIAIVRNAMVGVSREGTAARAFAGARYVAGGKTGTAQVYSLKGEKYDASKIDERLRDHAWYIAYAPADKPRIAMAVLVENGGFGAQSAAPIARRVLDYYLLGERPQAPGSGPLFEAASEEERD